MAAFAAEMPGPGTGGPAQDRVTVIVVENQPLELAVVADALHPLGVRVVPLGDITRAPPAPARPGAATILMTDMGPGGIAVRDLLARFHAARPGGAVVFMTDLSQRRGALGAARHNDVLLRKPFSAPDLRHAVARAIGNLRPHPRPPVPARNAA